MILLKRVEIIEKIFTFIMNQFKPFEYAQYIGIYDVLLVYYNYIIMNFLM